MNPKIYRSSLRTRYSPAVFSMAFLITGVSLLLLPCKGYSQNPSISSFSPVRDSAFGSTWDTYDTTLVAYNSPSSNGYYNVYFAHVTPANTLINETCFTCGNPLLPGKNVGSPAFQPGGRYVAVIAEKANHPGSSNNSVPGIGTFSDVWFMTRDGLHAYQMTNTADTGNASGVLFPFFSPDGHKFTWTEMNGPVNILNGRLAFGAWVIKTADITDDSILGPSLTNIQTIQPGGVPAFNEGYGWSPDGSKILFASDYDQFWVWDDQIYEMDTNGSNIHQLTQCCDYNEHGFYSTNGNYIIWMTNTGTNTASTLGGDDWFIMHSDSTHKQRLTFFNDTLSPYWTGDTHILGHGCFSPDGTRIIGDVGGSQPIQTDPTQIGAVYIYTLDNVVNGLASIENKTTACKIYPNPSADIFSIAVNKTIMNGKVTIFDGTGKVVYSDSFNGSKKTIDCNLSAGIYMVLIADGTRTWMNKFIKE